MNKLILAALMVFFLVLPGQAVETTSEMVGNDLVVTVTLSPTDQAWMENDLLSIEDWVKEGVLGKMRKCRSRMIKQWDEVLRNDPAVTSIPTSQVEWLQLVTSRSDYLSRLNREMKDTATRLVQMKLNSLVGLGYDGLPASDSTTIEDYNSTAGYEAYKRVSVLEVGTPGPGVKTITVTVYWDNDDRNVTDTVEVVEQSN